VDIVKDFRPFRHDVDEGRVRQDQDYDGFKVLDTEDVRETPHHRDGDTQCRDCYADEVDNPGCWWIWSVDRCYHVVCC